MGWKRTTRRTCCRRHTRTRRPQRRAPAQRADGPLDRQPSSASSACYASSGYPLGHIDAVGAREICALSRVITAQCRRTQGAKKSPCHNLKTRLAAKILMQQAEQQMVLPDTIDAEIASRQAFAVKATFLQHPDRGRIGGNAGGLDAMKIEFPEQRRQ